MSKRGDQEKNDDLLELQQAIEAKLQRIREIDREIDQWNQQQLAILRLALSSPSDSARILLEIRFRYSGAGKV